MDNNIFSENLKRFLLEYFPDARLASGNKQVVIRCRMCGDSMHDSNARHLYISLGLDGKPPMYHCFKCQSSGILTPDVLKEWSDVDNTYKYSDIMKELNNFTKSNRPKLIKNNNISIRNIYNDIIEDSEISKLKLWYINNRLGLNLSYDDILRNKIVLNIGDLLYRNNIDSYTRPLEVMNDINRNYVGFLTMDNNSIIMRNIHNKLVLAGAYRYINYSLFNTKNGLEYYTIPTICNIYNGIRIHIAEGPFDILSVFYNINNACREQNIYTACKGKAYIDVAKIYLKRFGIICPQIHFYIDNDLYKTNDINILKSFCIKIKSIGIESFIHNNSMLGENDFGVPKNKIINNIIKI